MRVCFTATLLGIFISCISSALTRAQATFPDGDPMAKCKEADLSDPTDAVCGRKEASISNRVAYEYIAKMDKKSRFDAELYYFMKNVQCSARAIWNDYGGNSGSSKAFFDISQNQCSTEFLRYVRLCTFNNVGYTETNVDKHEKEFQICYDATLQASWETSTGRVSMLRDPNDFRPWYLNLMRGAGRPRD